MAVYALADVNKHFNRLMDQIMRDITNRAGSKTTSAKPKLERTAKGGAITKPGS